MMGKLISELMPVNVIFNMLMVGFTLVVVTEAQEYQAVTVLLSYVVGFVLLLLMMLGVMKVLKVVLSWIVSRPKYRRMVNSETYYAIFKYNMRSVYKKTMVFLIVYTAGYLMMFFRGYGFDIGSLVLSEESIWTMVLYMGTISVYTVVVAMSLYVKLTFFNEAP